jgi:hypothetical protein
MSRQTKTKKSVRRLRKDRRRRTNKRGGAVTFPLEYYGTSSGRYLSDVEPAGTSAYGSFMSVSQGVPSLDGMVGPNVGPYQGASCTQTGGRKSRSRKSKSKSKSRSRRSKSRSNRK